MIIMYFTSPWLLVILGVFHTHHCLKKADGRSRSFPCASWYQAMDMCSLLNGHRVPVINNKYDYTYVTKLMQTLKLESAWLGLQRRFLPEYLWLDCTKPPEIFLAQDWGDISRCVNLNVRDDQLEVSPCSFTNKGVICQVPDCTVCNQPHHTRCDKIQDRCFISACASFSWEAGKAHCRSQGYEMAILKNDWFPKHVSEPKKNDFEDYFRKSCQHYWVGLRKQEWFYKNSVTSNMTSVYWAGGEPSEEGNCSIIKRTANSFHWKAVSCDAQHPVLCVPVQTSPGMTSTVIQTTIQEYTLDEQPKVVKSADFKMPISIHLAVWMSAIFAMIAFLCVCGRYIIKVLEKITRPEEVNNNGLLRWVRACLPCRSGQTNDNTDLFGPKQMRKGKPTDEALAGLFKESSL